MSGRPTLSELIIAIDTRTRFFLAAEAAPVGSSTQEQAKREYAEAAREAKRVEAALGQYISNLELRLSATQFDRRRS